MADPFLAWAGLILTWVECLVFFLTCRAQSRPGATRNTWAGIRIQATMASDVAWVAGHRAAVPLAKRAAVVLLPLSVIAICFLGYAPAPVLVVEWALMLGGLAWILVATRTAARAAEAAGVASRVGGR